MKRILAVVTALVIVAGVAVAMGWRPWDRGLPEDAAFVMGDDVVTIADLDSRNDSLRALYGVQEPVDDDEKDAFRRQSAKSMAISLLLDSAVEEASIEVPDTDVDAAFDAFLASQFEGDRQAFLDVLGNVSSSEDAVRAEIRRQMEIRLLLDEVVGDVQVSEADIAAAFDERRATLDTPERRAVSNIVLSTRREAEDARGQLDAGSDVAALAATVSIDAATRDSGGALGAVTRAELVPAVATAVFRTRPGRPYGPVRGPQGWNIGVVTKVMAAEPAKLSTAREQLRAALESEEAERRWTAWVEEELRDADVEYADEYLPSDPYSIAEWDEAGLSDDSPEEDE